MFSFDLCYEEYDNLLCARLAVTLITCLLKAAAGEAVDIYRAVDLSLSGLLGLHTEIASGVGDSPAGLVIKRKK